MDISKWLTLGQVVHESGASEGLVRRYDRLKLIESRRDPYGRRLFPPGTGRRIKRLKAKRIAGRTPAAER